MSGTLQIFISYAHEDSALRDKLEHHLKFLERMNLTVLWHDRKIDAGSKWENEIDKHLDVCDIILLLITANFMASDYCYCIEMHRAMERHNTEQACVIPIILLPTVWEGTPFSELQALPQNRRPVFSEYWHSPDAAFVDIAEGIKKVVSEYRSRLRTKLTSSDLYDSLLRLDFRQQGKIFNQFLKDGHRTGAFVIYGEREHGQDWLLNRLLYRLSKRLSEQAYRGQIGKVCTLDFASRIRKRNLETLWRELAAEIGLKTSGNPLPPETIIDTIYTLLKTQTVVLILRNPIKIGEEYVKQFLEAFWSPLSMKCATQETSSFHYCLLFLVDNDDCIDNWLTIEAASFDQSWKPSTPIKLNKLTKFHDDLLTSWIDHESDAWISTPVVQDLLNDSDGIPEQILDHICTFFNHDWYEREKVWLKY